MLGKKRAQTALLRAEAAALARQNLPATADSIVAEVEVRKRTLRELHEGVADERAEQVREERNKGRRTNVCRPFESPAPAGH
eukprot:SAG22_NODE_537_length_9361_cov_53.700821_3_plen_82_part_00